MKLSGISRQFSLGVHRDGVFTSLGSFTHDSPNQLVFINDEKFLALLLKKENISCVIIKENLIPSIPENVNNFRIFYLPRYFLTGS